MAHLLVAGECASRMQLGLHWRHSTLWAGRISGNGYYLTYCLIFTILIIQSFFLQININTIALHFFLLKNLYF